MIVPNLTAADIPSGLEDIDGLNIKGFRWEMTKDEVNAAAARFWERSEPSRSFYQQMDDWRSNYTVMTYEDLPVFSYRADINLCVGDVFGLDLIEYLFRNDTEEETNKNYVELEKILAEKLGIPYTYYGGNLYGYSWDIPEKEVSISLYKADYSTVELMVNYTGNRLRRITDTTMPEPFDPRDDDDHSRFSAMWVDKVHGGLGSRDRARYTEWETNAVRAQTPFTLYDDYNIFDFIRTFGLSEEEIREELEKRNELWESKLDGANEEQTANINSQIFTEREISALTSKDALEFIMTFTSPYAVCNNEDMFVLSPKWLYWHTIEDYDVAYVDKSQLRAKLNEGKYDELGLTDEALKAFKRKLEAYVELPSLTRPPVTTEAPGGTAADAVTTTSNVIIEADDAGTLAPIVTEITTTTTEAKNTEDIEIQYIPTQPDAPVKATFHISDTLLKDGGNNPGDTGGLLNNLHCTADGTVYVYAGAHEVKDLLEQLKENFASDDLIKAIRPYCDENGNFIYGRLADVQRVIDYGLLDNYEYVGYLDSFLISEDYEITFDDDGDDDFIIYERNEEYTKYRRIIEWLWEGSAMYPNITVTAVTDLREGKREAYFQIVGDKNEVETAKVQLEAHGADMTKCRFSSPEDIRAEWLPVTSLVQYYDKLLLDENVTDDSPYYITFDETAYIDGEPTRFSGTYSCVNEHSVFFTSFRGTEDYLRELGVSDDVIKEIEENGLDSFYKLTPYTDGFDLFPLPEKKDEHLSDSSTVFCAIADGVVIENWRATAADSGQKYNEYAVFVPENRWDMTKLVNTVRTIRRYPRVDDSGNGYSFELKKIEVVTEYSRSLADRRIYARVIADKKYWENIQNFFEWELDIPRDSYELAETAVDTDGLEWYEEN